MERGLQKNTDLNISASNIFSNSHFKKVISQPDYPLLEKKINKYSNVLGRSFTTRKEALETLYGYLLSNYRCEYIYKNLITKRILLGKHSLNTSNLINEFRVGSSLADIVLFNGTSTVYEIKTELDSPERLSDQLSDYQKAFTKICLVIHHSQEEKYLDIVKDSSVGLKVLNKRFHLSDRKEAEKNAIKLDVSTMFKCLRKAEYTNILNSYYGSVPDVPNMYYFKECLELAKKIKLIKFHRLMNNELKKRKPREKQILNSGKIPAFLSNICLAIDPNGEQYDRLFKYLNKKLI
jgi:hypothetical protein